MPLTLGSFHNAYAESENGLILLSLNRSPEKLLALSGKATQMKKAYDFPEAYRTSNQVDRLMHYQDRLLFQMQYFHGSIEAARLQMRAHVLLWNFHPYGQRRLANCLDFRSPFEALNGFSFDLNWLHNLLMAGSMNGYRAEPPAINKIR